MVLFGYLLLVMCPVERKLDERVLWQSKDSISGMEDQETQVNVAL